SAPLPAPCPLSGASPHSPAPHKDDRAMSGPPLGPQALGRTRSPTVGSPGLRGGRCASLPRSAGVSQGESAVRWIRRAEAGGFKVEYAAIVLLTATLVTAVFSF